MEGVKMANFEDFLKLDLRVAEIISVEEIEGADKLYKLGVSLGSEERTICAGLKQFYSIEELKGKKIILISNLEPRTIRGIESKGMLLAASSPNKEELSLLSLDKDIENGSKIS
jgi:methionyl-tRNA synthetase